MRTVRTKVYKFSELSKKAKEKALEDHRNSNYMEYNWEGEAMNSLKEFAKHFGAELSDWSISWDDGSYSYAKFETTDLEEDEHKWLTAKIEAMGSYDQDTLMGNGDCIFTGYTMDESAADGARIAYSQGERDIDNILQAAFRSWLKACQEDFAYQYTEEYFKEEAEANNFEFTQDGKRF